MKLFLKKIVLFSISFFGINYLFIETLPKDFYLGNEIYYEWKTKYKFSKYIKSEESLNIILGNSVCNAAINPPNLKAYNLCLTASSPVEGYYLLKNILKNNIIKNLYITYSSSHINWRASFLHLTVFTEIFPKETIDEIKFMIQLLNDKKYINVDNEGAEDWEYFPLLVQIDFIIYKFKALFTADFSYHKFISQIDDLFSTRREKEITNFDSLLNFYPISCVNKRPPARAFKWNKDWSPVNTFYLKQISKLCVQNNINCIYIQPPLNTQAKFPPKSYFDKFDEILQETEFKIIPSKIVFIENQYFCDNFGHTNESGANYFYDNYLNPKLKKIGLDILD